MKTRVGICRLGLWLGHTLSRTSGRLFLTNFLSGALVAGSVYLLGQTILPDLLLGWGIKVLLLCRYALAEYRTLQFPTGLIITVYLLASAFAAASCTFIRSAVVMAGLNSLLAGLLLYNGWRGHLPFILTLGLALVMVLITVAALLDNLLRGRSLRRASRQAVDRQQSEAAILRHITHSVCPTVQTALSPVIAITELVRLDPSLDRIVALRRDGSHERVSDALATAVTSLEQIRDILVSTEDIFNNRLDEQDFSEIDIRELFNRDILPLYSHCRFEIRVSFGDVRSVRLHRSSFIHALRNLLRNAELHAFPDGFERQGPLFASFTISRTARQLVIAYENNGVPLPPEFTARDFLAFGRKGKNSPGKGLGGAWVDKFIELHNGSFTIEGTDPVRFRMVLPIRR